MRLPLTGIIPCAGRSTRLPRLPCSKEIFPIQQNGKGFLVAGDFALNAMLLCGCKEIYFVLRDEKLDILKYYSSNIQATAQHRLLFLPIKDSSSVPATVNFCYPLVRGKIVLFGFPDILFFPHDLFMPCLKQLHKSRADAVLAIFPVDSVLGKDAVSVNDRGEVTGIIPKPTENCGHLTWIAAVWRETFSQFLNTFLSSEEKHRRGSSPRNTELQMGDVLAAAVQNGLNVGSVFFSSGRFLDIGTPESIKQIYQFIKRSEIGHDNH